ncbi:hypothetical protein BGX34_012009, partial [Mortierella sp. NVP85]
MSYERVNDSSDSEGDVATSSLGHPIPNTPSDRLASLARSTNFSTHRYARVSAIDEEGEASAGRGKDKEKPVDSSRSDEIEIHVRFNEGQDLSLRVSRTDTIAQFKDKVKEAKPTIKDKYLRLIYAGRILADNKTLIDSLPKSLFTQVEEPHHHQSRLSSSVEAVEAAASNILAGISSRRASLEKTT